VPTFRSEWIPSPRRVRTVFGGVSVADSSEMMLLRQHGFLPVYYFPERDVRTDLLRPSNHETSSPYKGTASYFDVCAGGSAARAAAWTYLTPKPGSPDTRGYFSFHWHAMDSWWEEDEVLRVHARDPYLRVDALPSSRHVAVRVAGELVAETTRPMIALETGLVPRYYLPRADVDEARLVASLTFSMCPYKGLARYFSCRVGDRLVPDVAWCYDSPLPDVGRIAGHLSFWQEHDDVSVEVDGLPLASPGLRPSGPGGEMLHPNRLFFAVPPPASRVEEATAGFQHDFARPNGRAEGPPDDLLDMVVEAAGGRQPGRSSPAATPSTRPAAFFTFGPATRSGSDTAPATGRPVEPLEGPEPNCAEIVVHLARWTRLFAQFGLRRSRGATRASSAPSPQQPPAPTPPAPTPTPPAPTPPAPTPTPAGTPTTLPPDVVCERSLRRVRIVIGGRTVADTSDAVLFARGAVPPAYFFPPGDVALEHLPEGARISPPGGFEMLEGRLAVSPGAIDALFEEDEEVHGGPRLPYHRVDAVSSSRHVLVRVDDAVVAESRRPVVAFETGRPPRFYLPRLDTAVAVLVANGRTIDSPYLGRAALLSARLGAGEVADVAWTYRDPISQCPKVAGRVCFDESSPHVVIEVR
jgi:uncharacterized protein (DUF427 family)